VKNLLHIPYSLPFAKYYREFDSCFYVDFPKQLELMGAWLMEFGCKRTLDIGAITGGCIEYISKLGMRMDGVQFTTDLKTLSASRLRESGIKSKLFVSPIDGPLKVPKGNKYDGIVTLGWFNLPLSDAYIKRYLDKVDSLLNPGGVFLFDYFEFRDIVIPPSEAEYLGPDVIYISHSELLDKTLRRYHLWVLEHERLLTEVSDLVDRSSGQIGGYLARSGLSLERSQFLSLNYPRYFCVATKGR
jgi:SAM-dependent methyltransferase